MPDNWWESSRKVEGGGDDWWKAAPLDRTVPKIRETELRQGQPESAWHSAWTSVRDSLFGTPERREARAEGLPVDPPPSEVYGGIADAAAFLGAGPWAMSRAAGAMSKIPGRIGKLAAAHPDATAAVIRAAGGAAPGAIYGDERAALAGAIAAAALGARRGPAVTAGAEAASAAPAAAAPVKAVVDKGREAASRHAQLMAFGKEVAKRNPKVGEKIHILLDEAGTPVRWLTQDEAAHTPTHLKTWVKNLWK